MAQWLSWLERRPVTAKVESSSLFWVVSNELTSLVNCIWIWNLSSAGRASALQAEGHRFEPYRFHILKENGEIAQLARAHGSYPWCRGFKSLSRYYLRSGSRRCFHFFCASSDERSHGKFTAVLARTWNFVWFYEEHRDNDRTKFWSMSCSRNPRR